MAEAPRQAQEDGSQAGDRESGTTTLSGRATPRGRTVVALVDDLFVQSRIEAAARATGQAVRYARTAEELREAAHGDGQTVVLVGMAATRLPWPDLIRDLKDHAADTFVLAFGPHKDLELRRRALEAGADRVIANSAFMKALPELLGAPEAEVGE